MGDTEEGLGTVKDAKERSADEVRRKYEPSWDAVDQVQHRRILVGSATVDLQCGGIEAPSRLT